MQVFFPETLIFQEAMLNAGIYEKTNPGNDFPIVSNLLGVFRFSYNKVMIYYTIIVLC
jgi:hypothetical protein